MIVNLKKASHFQAAIETINLRKNTLPLSGNIVINKWTMNLFIKLQKSEKFDPQEFFNIEPETKIFSLKKESLRDYAALTI